jgi:hypothetical protein
VWSEAQRSDKFAHHHPGREADHAPSGVHQEQIAFNIDKESVAVCREATIMTKRPSGNRTAFSFKGE